MRVFKGALLRALVPASVRRLKLTGGDVDDVDQPQNAEAPSRQQLQNAHARVAQIETVYTDASQQNRENKRSCLVFL